MTNELTAAQRCRKAAQKLDIAHSDLTECSDALALVADRFEQIARLADDTLWKRAFTDGMDQLRIGAILLRDDAQTIKKVKSIATALELICPDAESK